MKVSERAQMRHSSDDAAFAAVVAWRERCDQSAARWIVDRTAPLVRSIAARRLPRAWMVDDAVQTTLSSLFGTLERFDARVSLAAWATGIARNTCGNILRSWRKRSVLSVGEAGVQDLREMECGGSAVCPAQTVAAREELGRVLARITLMRGTDRVVASLILEGETSPRVVAQQTGLTAGAARVRVHRIRRALRDN